MFAPVLDDEEEDEELRREEEEEVVRVQFVEEMMGVVIIKINNILLLLSLGVAAFVQFCTLEPRYLNALMWGEATDDDDDFIITMSDNTTTYLWTGELQVQQEVQDEDTIIWTSTKFHRTLQSIATILLLCLVRAAVFPDVHRNNNNATTSTFEAVLADMLFHIKCRLGIGFLACVTPLPFHAIETTVVCVSVALQLAPSSWAD